MSRSPLAYTRPLRSRSRSRSRERRSRSRSPRIRQEPSQLPSPTALREDTRDRRDRRRGRSLSRSPTVESGGERRKERRRQRSRSVSSSSSTSSDRRRHKRRKEKHRKHSRSKSRDREKKERKKEKKEKKDKKKVKSGAVSHQWGKYGLINETDLYNKEQEFRAWLVEERKINPETISKDQTKKEFAKFVEDYNTATLPHEKFYHMEAYERRMSALRAGEDIYEQGAADELELRRVQNERIEAGKMKLLGMDIKHNMGVRMDGTVFDG
ncbi:hypothetical protein A0H81_10204 [Grifola frondosa]|uniref:Uncharacterized protein n=1 Tax=Grifola frondosa TaxID=5627 RepID=A0A1C7LYP8_GRIFR|nr:hypothetical protein A0H81_10204 [Grifola frondosa]